MRDERNIYKNDEICDRRFIKFSIQFCLIKSLILYENLFFYEN